MVPMDEELQRSLGDVARAGRGRLGLTQTHAATKAGTRSRGYGRSERGDIMPSVPSLRRISIVLGISSDALLGVSPYQVAATVDGAHPEWNLSPELRRILHQLRTWPSRRLKVLSKVL